MTTTMIPPMTTDQQRTIRIAVGGVIGLTAILLVRKYIKKKQAEAATTEYNEALQQLPIATNNLSITEAEAKVIANNLYAAMNRVGTDEDTIISLLENRNGDDLKLIIKAFGVRKYGTFGAPAFSWMKGTDLDLIGWLRKELSGSKLTKVLGYFQKAGINF